MAFFRKPSVATPSDPAPFVVHRGGASYVVAREAPLGACFGVTRQPRPCQRLRDGRVPAEGLALSAVCNGRLVGTLRLWHVSAGRGPALAPGPLAVHPACRKLRLGKAPAQRPPAAAKERGHGAAVLFGAAP